MSNDPSPPDHPGQPRAAEVHAEAGVARPVRRAAAAVSRHEEMLTTLESAPHVLANAEAVATGSAAMVAQTRWAAQVARSAVTEALTKRIVGRLT